jgi:hypothetical protein
MAFNVLGPVNAQEVLIQLRRGRIGLLPEQHFRFDCLVEAIKLFPSNEKFRTVHDVLSARFTRRCGNELHAGCSFEGDSFLHVWNLLAHFEKAALPFGSCAVRVVFARTAHVTVLLSAHAAVSAWFTSFPGLFTTFQSTEIYKSHVVVVKKNLVQSASAKVSYRVNESGS